MALRGLLISWATPATSSPIEAMRSPWISAACACFRSASARRSSAVRDSTLTSSPARSFESSSMVRSSPCRMRSMLSPRPTISTGPATRGTAASSRPLATRSAACASWVIGRERSRAARATTPPTAITSIENEAKSAETALMSSLTVSPLPSAR